jgi:chitinase
VRQASDQPPGPFGGIAHALPGRIEAEHYDAGGQDIGYHDSTAGNEQGLDIYRNDDVDIKVSDAGGHAVGWMPAGEWLAYTVGADSARQFTIRARVGSALPDRTFHIEIDGEDVSGPVSVPRLADWDRYNTVVVPGVSLTPGEHSLRFVVGPLDWIDFQWLSID